MKEEKSDIVIGLAGNPNVGKSAFFHQVTGIDVDVSNYPGTTVEIAEGTTRHKNHSVKVIDLPGVYSLGAVAEDERVARKNILSGDLDVIINVINATNLERNLYLSLQLLELGKPVVIALNQYDVALNEGIKTDPEILSDKLGVPVIPTVSTQGKNVSEVFSKAIELASKGEKAKSQMRMGKELEKIIGSLSNTSENNLEEIPFDLPPRTLAVKLLEGDEEIIGSIDTGKEGEKILRKARDMAQAIKRQHGEAAAFRIAREKHGIANLIAEESTKHIDVEPPLSEKIGRLTTQMKTGIPILIGVFVGLILLLFYGGGFLEGILESGWDTYVQPQLMSLFQYVSPNESIVRVLDIGINLGIKGILLVLLPYITVFFLALAFLEDTGYLSRMAYVMDSIMHKVGLHGEAVVPMLGGFGCNVPAIMATRGLTTRRQRLISSVLITMIPCSARTAVILGTVGTYSGIFPALVIYGIIIFLIFVVGVILNKFVSGKTTGMILEIAQLKKPMLKPVLAKTWSRMREFVYIATPLLIIGSLSIGVLEVSGVMDSIVEPLSPFTTGLLGLPAVTIIPLLYGIIRKEGALVLLIAVSGTSSLGTFMTPLQLFIFALVVAIYIPCIATFAVLKRELGWKEAFLISIFTIVLAVVLGSVFFHLNPLGFVG